MVYKAALAIAALIFAVLSARWFEEGDYYDPVRGRRHCAAPPAAVKDWSLTNRARQPGDRVNLERWLAANKSDVNELFGAFCWTPLHTAARFGREDLAELLIAGGADVRARDEPAGYTALHLAARYGEIGAARVLIARGADVNAETRFGGTPLGEAAVSGQRMTELLLSAGARPRDQGPQRPR